MVGHTVKLTIATDHVEPSYETGSVLTGATQLEHTTGHSKHRVAPSSISKHELNVSLTGIEYSSTTVTESAGKQGQTRTTKHEEEHVIFQAEEHSDISGQGTKFPFSFHLPENLPGSFKVKKGSSKCSIRYELRAALYDELGREVAFAKLPITIIAKWTAPKNEVPDEPISSFAGQACFPVTKHSIFRAGSIGMFIRIANGTQKELYAGHSYPIYMSAENASSLSISDIQVKMSQDIRWSSNGQQFCASRTMLKQTINPKQFPELSKRTKPSLAEAYKYDILDWKELCSVTIPTDTILYQSPNNAISVENACLTVSFTTKGWKRNHVTVDLPCLLALPPLPVRNETVTAIPLDTAQLIVCDHDEEMSFATAEVMDTTFAEARILQ